VNLRSFAVVVGATVVLALTGCASAPPQLAVPLVSGSVQPSQRVGIVMSALPKIDTQFPGASCLLCMAAASMANSSLTDHARTLPYEDLPKLKELLAEQLTKRGSAVIVIADEVKVDELPKFSSQGPNVASKDFGALQKKHGIDKLLVIDIRAIGFERTYSAYFPTSDPKAMLRGLAFLVDLKSNTYEWYQPLNLLRSAEGPWDEPAKFPGLTNAYFQVVELGKDEVLNPFKP
jgi:hypothetical protein